MNRSGIAILKRLYHQGIQPFAQPHCVKDSTKIAIRDNIGQHTYGDISKQSDKVGHALKRISSSNSPSNVAFLTPNNHHYSVIQYGIWKSGNSCVPLCKSHPPETLKYYIEDSEASVLVLTKEYAEKVSPIHNGVGQKI